MKFLTKSREISMERYAQSLFDEAIKLCPNNDYAYREKAVPFKIWRFHHLEKLIDKAVEIKSQSKFGLQSLVQISVLRLSRCNY